MFEKMMFVLKCVWKLYLHRQEMGHNCSRGRPESVAPEFSSWRRTEVKISPPKATENRKPTVSSFHDMFVLGNEATFVPVWPDWLEFDGSEGAESIQDVLVSHRKPRFAIKVWMFWSAAPYRFCSFGFVVPTRKSAKLEPKVAVS
jgi:hypothetical protein